MQKSLTSKPSVSFLLYKQGDGSQNHTLDRVIHQHVERARYLYALGYVPVAPIIFHSEAAAHIGKLQA